MTPTPGEDPAAADAPAPIDPAAIISTTNELPTRLPGAWRPPPPLSLGPLEPPPGPLVSPALAAYRPSAVPWPSDEPSTTSISISAPISAAPVTSLPSASAPPAAAAPPVEDPVSAAPASALPVPVPPAPASYYPPPYPQYPPPARYPAPAAYPPPYAAPSAYPPGVAAYPPSAPPAPPMSYPPAVGYIPGYPGPAYPPYPGYGAYSDKSKQTAGLLQLLLGLMLGVGGVGRLYAGNTELGIVQVILSGVGWVCFVCGFFFAPLWLLFFGLWGWFVVDGVFILAGAPVDGKGRPLR